MTDKTEKILVIQTAFPGDTVLTLPMLKFLKELYPASIVDVVCIPSTEEIFNACPYVNNTLVLDKKGKHRTINAFISFCLGIKKIGYTRVYSPHRSFRSSLLVLLSGIKESYGFDKNSAARIYKHRVHYDPAKHEVQRNLSLAGMEVNRSNWKILPEVKISGEVINKINQLFSNFDDGKKFAAVAPGSVWNTKKYPAEYYIEIVKFLVSEGYFVILVGGAQDENTCLRIKNGAQGNIYSSAGKFSFIESIEILKRCSILVSNDSAPAHLAMCAGIPVLMLYCSTVPDFGFYPYNQGSTYLSYNDLYCKPCGIHGYEKCPIKTFDCGYKLIPAEVINKIEVIVNGSQIC